jgi:GH15 family glucan-1,4-alpha-glucosidase
VNDETPVNRVDGYAPIGDYAAIGDGRTLALVARDGSVDWLPLPTIDQEAAFGALLDAERGGRCSVSPVDEFDVVRRYLPHTNVLETTFTTGTGRLRVTDALTLQDGGVLPWVELARRVECVEGAVRVRWSVEPRFGFARETTRIEKLGDAPVAIGKRLLLAVRAWGIGEPVHGASSVSGTVDLAAGDSGLLVCLAVDREPFPEPTRDEVEARSQSTADAWKRWVRRRTYDGPWPKQVERSALALKLLVYGPSGAMAAAGTTGLPERIGGERNYDYRFCWVRDTAFALDALGALGYREQVHGTLSWLLDATAATHPRLQPLYALDGSVPRSQEDLPLEGYRGSRPVRRGNKAATQLQLGSYGDLLETVWHYVNHGNVLDPDTGRRIAECADLVCEIWRNEDAGLWELDEHRHYTISKMGCWLALTRATQLAGMGQVPGGNAARWSATAERVRAFVETRCWSSRLRSYTFYADSDALDCAVLLAARFGYADTRPERMNSTIDALLREQRAGGPLFYRYSGMASEEGAFLACSFWMVTALAKTGRVSEAHELMEELLPYANDVGLWSEECDPDTRELLGNFPQALTHLSLINAAAAIAAAQKGVEDEQAEGGRGDRRDEGSRTGNRRALRA